MDQENFTTIGREIHPNMEVKISCVTNVNHLDYPTMEDRFRIVYIKKGVGSFHNGSYSQLITSPMLLCLNDSDIVSLQDTSDLQMDIMYFDPICYERYIPFDSILAWKENLGDDAFLFRAFFERSHSYQGACSMNLYFGSRIARLISLTNAELSQQKDFFWPCRSRSFFLELLLLTNTIYSEEISNEESLQAKPPYEIEAVVDWLNIHFQDKLVIDDITKEFHTNKTSLNQKFKANLGVTVMEYVIGMRMQLACSLLRKTYLSVKEIIERSGYRDGANFTRAFKKHAGCTPTEYRNQFEAAK